MAQRAAVREAVLVRDGSCRLAAAGADHGYDVGRCFGRLEMHEVRKASQMTGGYTEANGRAVCSFHNSQMEADADLAAFARSVGLVKRRGD